MPEQFFIKRGDKINGPFTVEKLQALKKAKKLKSDDEVSKSAEGPWKPLSAHEKANQSSEQPNPSPAESSPKTVACEDCGGMVSRRAHQCPHCGAPIGQSADQVPSAVAEDTDDEHFGTYYDDEVAYEDDGSDEYEPTPRRKRSKANKSTNSSKGRKKKASSANEAKGIRLAYKILGGIVAVWIGGAVIFGILDQNRFFESAEYKESKRRLDESTEKTGRLLYGDEGYEEKVIRDADYERAKRELNR
jgi:hypothetical protein